MADDTPRPAARTSSDDATGSPEAMYSRTSAASTRRERSDGSISTLQQRLLIKIIHRRARPASVRPSAASAETSALSMRTGSPSRPGPRHRRWSCGRRCRERRRPASSTDRRRARGAGWSRSTTMRSARLPASIDPISCSRPSVRAPARVAIHSTSRAGSAPGSSAHRLQHRGKAHLVEHVEAVVAGRAVGAQRDRDALLPASRRPARLRIRASDWSRGSASP